MERLSADLSLLHPFFIFDFSTKPIEPPPHPPCARPETNPASVLPEKLVPRRPVQNSSHVNVKIGSKTWRALFATVKATQSKDCGFGGGRGPPGQPKDIAPGEPKLQPRARVGVWREERVSHVGGLPGNGSV